MITQGEESVFSASDAYVSVSLAGAQAWGSTVATLGLQSLSTQTASPSLSGSCSRRPPGWEAPHSKGEGPQNAGSPMSC